MKRDRRAIEEGFILDVLEHYTTYKTYGGEGGDVYSFLQRIEGLNFRGAFEKLADLVGVQLHTRQRQFSASLEFRLSDAEFRAYDVWVWLKKRRLQSRWLALDDDWGACLSFMEGIWASAHVAQALSLPSRHSCRLLLVGCLCFSCSRKLMRVGIR